jgi:hypothetical protein
MILFLASVLRSLLAVMLVICPSSLNLKSLLNNKVSCLATTRPKALKFYEVINGVFLFTAENISL